MPDNNGEGQGQGLAMLRLEARRYKREMQQIWKRRELHEQKKYIASPSCENSSRFHDDGWSSSNICSPSTATSGTLIFRNREDGAISRIGQLAIVDEGTQTDIPSTSGIRIETKKAQLDEVGVRSMLESRTDLSETRDISKLRICSRHCDELRSRITQEAACECLADTAVRVNADVVFTAKPKRVLVGGQMETSDFCFSRAHDLDGNGIVLNASTNAASPNGSLENIPKSIDPVQCSPTGLMSLVYPVPQRDNACSPIHNLHGCGASFRSLPTKNSSTTPTKNLSLQLGRLEPERAWSVPPPTLSSQISTPQPEASLEISGCKRVHNELTEEGGMAAKLATRIKQALCAINGKADSRSSNSTSSVSGQAIQSIKGCSFFHKDEFPEMKFSEEPDKICDGSGASNNKDLSVCNICLPDICEHSCRVPVSSQNLIKSTPPSDADIYFQNVIAALSNDRHAPHNRSGSSAAGKVSSAQAVRKTHRSAEATIRANVKSCGDHHATHQADVMNDSMKIDMRQSESSHVKEKQKLLSNVRKLQQVAETAKRLYTDLVDCAYDDLRSSTDCGNMVIRKNEGGSGDISKCPRLHSEVFASTESTSANGANSTSAGDNQGCGKCHVSLPQVFSKKNPRACTKDTAAYTSRGNSPCGFEQPPEEARADCLDEITIELSDDMATNIKVSQNDSKNRPGFNVEISTPNESPCQRVGPPDNRGENVVRQGTASWKESLKDATHRSDQVDTVEKDSSQTNWSHQLVKKAPNNCLLDPYCVGPRDSCHMPAYRKCSGACTVSCSETKRDSKECSLVPNYVGPRNHARNNCSKATRENGSRDQAAIVSINHPKKDSKLCLLNHCGVGSRNNCHMSACEKTCRSLNRPGGNSRLNRNNGTHLDDKDLSCLCPRCLVHHEKEMVNAKEKFENNCCVGKQGSNGKDEKSNLRTEIPGHVVIIEERKKKDSKKFCRGMSKLSQGRLNKISKGSPLTEDRDHRDLCTSHDVRSSSLKVEGNETTNGGHDETSRQNRPSNEKTDLNDPVKTVYKLFQDSSRTREGERTQFKFPATEIFAGEHAYVGNETKQSPQVVHTTDNATATLRHKPQPDAIDRAAAAAGFAKEIESMIAVQLDKSSRRTIESNHLLSRQKLLEDQNDSYPQTKLDRVVLAAANAVNKCMPISLLLPIKQDELNQKPVPRKGPTPRATVISDANGASFYDQLDQQLELLASQRMKLLRQERIHLQSLFGRLQEHDPKAEFYMKERSSTAFKFLANDYDDLEEPKRSMWMRRSNDCSTTGDGSVGFQIPGSKRQRSITFPARKRGKKLLRLSVGKPESHSGRKKQDQHTILPASLNQASRYSNRGFDSRRSVKFEPFSSRFSGRRCLSLSEACDGKLSDTSGPNFDVSSINRLSSSSFGKWKPLSEQAQAKPTTKRRICNTWKIRSTPWVERMAKAKDTFPSLFRPMLLAHPRKEPQLKATVYRRSFPPPGLMFRSSVGSSNFRKHVAAGRAFPRVQHNPSIVRGKHPNPSFQYDINTGRKIVDSELEQGELTKAECNLVTTNLKSRASWIRSPSTLNSRGNIIRVKGWNADPLIRTDIPHKPTDIMRYNRNVGQVVQVRRGDAHEMHKTSPGTSGRSMNLRRVTFAGMEVHNSRNSKSCKDLSAQGDAALESIKAKKKAITSLPGKVRSAVGKRRNFSRTKSPSMRSSDKVHRYGNGGGQWAHHKGFWTEMFKSEFFKVSEVDSIQDIMTFGSISQTELPMLKVEIAHGTDPLGKLGIRAGTEGSSIMETSVLDGGDLTVFNCENIPRMANAPSSETNTEIRNEHDVKVKGRSEEIGKPQNPDLFKSLSFFNSHGLEGSAINEHISVAVKSDFLSDAGSDKDEQAESCYEFSSSIEDGLERHERDISSKDLPVSPFTLLGGVFSESIENVIPGCMIDHLQESTSVQQEMQSEVQCLALERITRQTFPDALGKENKGQLKKMELEQTLMNIVLHSILQDDLLQDQEVSASSMQPISLPINRTVVKRVDKEVEVFVQSHEMIRYPTPDAVLCINRTEHGAVPHVGVATEHDAVPHVGVATEHDAVPHVDVATEQEIISHIDKGTELEISLFFKDQGIQTADVEPLIQSILRPSPSAPHKYSTKLQTTQVHDEAIERQVPCSNVGAQTPEKNAAISTTSPNPSAATSMSMPVFCQHLGISILPTILPTVHVELPIHVTSSTNVPPPPVSTATCSFHAGVNPGIQATRANIQLYPEEIAAQDHHKVSKSSTRDEALPEQLGVVEEESEKESDWEDLKGSSPSTPSTPLSSPGHKTSLKKAMELYACNPNTQATVLARQDIQPSVPEVCQLLASNGLQPDQTFVGKLESPIQIATEMISKDLITKEPPQTSADVTRRFTSWAKLKKMEEAALVLIGAASMKTLPLISSSEYSCESSLEFHSLLSPGEMNTEEVGRSSTNSRFLDSMCISSTFKDLLEIEPQIHAWGSLGSGRASVGEIGEVEAGILPSSNELGEIHRHNYTSQQGSEPGELDAVADVSSPRQLATHSVV
ncbi:uncharacterized protein [Physcomitrium patens]|uniref:uncharacterized protein isoform X4 n=1 Tax=Physcomitrium patens TaxID=3218 RepID=UPI003CCE3158